MPEPGREEQGVGIGSDRVQEKGALEMLTANGDWIVYRHLDLGSVGKC